jgi:polysaccharide export outer membrane protein
MHQQITSLSSANKRTFKSFFKVHAVAVMLVSCASFANAQGSLITTQNASPDLPKTISNKTDVSPDVAPTDSRYRIGPGDVVELRVLKSPLLSRESIRVDQRGMIRIPMFQDEIQAACLTESELAEEIAKRYLKYMHNPHVDIFVKDFQSQPVAVIGSVNSPGQFRLQRQLRLLELLAFAGGISDKAGRSIHLIHASGPTICEGRVAQTVVDPVAKAMSSYQVAELLKGSEEANPYVRPGDIVSIPEADQVFVTGNVFQPRSILLREPITVSRAIAMAGGPQRDSKTDRIRIIRQLPGSTTKSEIYVNLKEIQKHQAEDIALQANDVVDVSASSGKQFLRTLMGGAGSMVTNLPIRVIP